MDTSTCSGNNGGHLRRVSTGALDSRHQELWHSTCQGGGASSGCGIGSIRRFIHNEPQLERREVGERITSCEAPDLFLEAPKTTGEKYEGTGILKRKELELGGGGARRGGARRVCLEWGGARRGGAWRTG